MFKRILIANRGEIALRIIRCCREMDVETVIVYSTADKDSLAVMAADKAVCIGPAKAAESYLNQDAIIETAIDRKSTRLNSSHSSQSRMPSSA